jgi:hypothetical protein
MQRVMKMCVRGALGLGTAALLLSGGPAQADPAAGAASRESQPRLLAQAADQPGEAEKLEQQRLQEQAKEVQEQQQKGQMKAKKMRGAVPEASREAVPAKPGGSRFGAGVIRKSEKPLDEE